MPLLTRFQVSTVVLLVGPSSAVTVFLMIIIRMMMTMIILIIMEAKISLILNSNPSSSFNPAAIPPRDCNSSSKTAIISIRQWLRSSKWRSLIPWSIKEDRCRQLRNSNNRITITLMTMNITLRRRRVSRRSSQVVRRCSARK